MIAPAGLKGGEIVSRRHPVTGRSIRVQAALSGVVRVLPLGSDHRVEGVRCTLANLRKLPARICCSLVAALRGEWALLAQPEGKEAFQLGTLPRRARLTQAVAMVFWVTGPVWLAATLRRAPRELTFGCQEWAPRLAPAGLDSKSGRPNPEADWGQAPAAEVGL